MDTCKYTDEDCGMSYDCYGCLTYNKYIAWRLGSENGFVPKQDENDKLNPGV